MKKILSILLSTILFAATCFTAAGCDFENLSSSNAMQRYTYDQGVHDYTAPEVEGEYIVKNGTTDYVLVIPADASDRVELAVDEFKVFTTRADTAFGVSYVVLAPEHPLVKKLMTSEHRFHKIRMKL